jgi:hypothetical protein
VKDSADLGSCSSRQVAVGGSCRRWSSSGPQVTVGQESGEHLDRDSRRMIAVGRWEVEADRDCQVKGHWTVGLAHWTVGLAHTHLDRGTEGAGHGEGR